MVTGFGVAGYFSLADGVSMEFKNVTARALANIYFDGKVISHGVTLEDGSVKTFGVIFPGSYHFGTEAAERMEIIAGECEVTLDGETERNVYKAGEHFDVESNSGFTIEFKDEMGQYICSYL